MIKWCGVFVLSLFVLVALTTPSPAPVVPGTVTQNYYLEPTASDNHNTIKGSPGVVYGIQTTNNSTTTNYIRLYNSGIGFNGCNSASNRIWGMEIPAPATASGVGGGFTASFLNGISFNTGISVCVTSGYGSTDTTNATPSAIMVNVQYN